MIKIKLRRTIIFEWYLKNGYLKSQILCEEKNPPEHKYSVTFVTKLGTKIMISAIRRGSNNSYPSCPSIVRFSYFTKFQTEFFLQSEALFFYSIFHASRNFRWYHFYSRNRSCCGRPEARDQMKARPHTLLLPWQGIDYTIWRFRSERLTTMLSASGQQFKLRTAILFGWYKKNFITRPNYAPNRRTILCLYLPGFQKQVFKHVKILSERSKDMKEQKKNKGSVRFVDSAYKSENAQFGLVMVKILG